MPSSHSRGHNKSVNILWFQTGYIIGTGPGCLLNHIKQMSLPDTEFTRSSADDNSVLS
jgi:hypothetical protein